MTTDTDLPAIHTQNDQQHFVVKTTIEELNLIIFLVNLQDPLGGFHSTSVSIFDKIFVKKNPDTFPFRLEFKANTLLSSGQSL